MRILLVEPQIRRNRKILSFKKRNDELLWYPPLGLMKISTYHKRRGHQVEFLNGNDLKLRANKDLFDAEKQYDRVYISTLFTYNFHIVCKTINYFAGFVPKEKIFVGGIMASLMSEDIYFETGVKSITGLIPNSNIFGFDDKINIDELPYDYDLLDPAFYAISDTYYGYTSRGCVNCCPWCGVPKIEPEYIDYVPLKNTITHLTNMYGEKARLKLMDNNVLASSRLGEIVDELLELGYGRGQYTKGGPKRQKVVDYNQGVDSTFINEESIALLAKINIKPLRIAFDRLIEKDDYIKAVKLARKYGFSPISNYLLYNFNDSPRDLYERLKINWELNAEIMKSFKNTKGNRKSGEIYSYPMRYAPINEVNGKQSNRIRDVNNGFESEKIDWLNEPSWTKKFIRNIELMKGAAFGAISATPSLAERTVGTSFEEFLSNLYMPENLLRYRNRYEKRIYKSAPDREPGTGELENFRKFILKLLSKQDERFIFFHNTVSQNSIPVIRNALTQCKSDKELHKWLSYYINKE